MAGKKLVERKRALIKKILKHVKRHDKFYYTKEWGFEYQYDIDIEEVKVISKNGIDIDINFLKKYGPKNRFAIMRYAFSSIIYTAYRLEEDPAMMYKFMKGCVSVENNINERWDSICLDILSVDEVKNLLFPLIILDYHNIRIWIEYYQRFFNNLKEFKKQLPLIHDQVDDWLEANKNV